MHVYALKVGKIHILYAKICEQMRGILNHIHISV